MLRSIKNKTRGTGKQDCEKPFLQPAAKKNPQTVCIQSGDPDIHPQTSFVGCFSILEKTVALPDAGRYSDSRINLLAAPSHALKHSGNGGFRPRLQRRARASMDFPKPCVVNHARPVIGRHVMGAIYIKINGRM